MGIRIRRSERSTAECSDAGDSWKYDCELCKPSGIGNAVRFIVIQETGKTYNGAAPYGSRNPDACRDGRIQGVPDASGGEERIEYKNL